VKIVHTVLKGASRDGVFDADIH